VISFLSEKQPDFSKGVRFLVLHVGMPRYRTPFKKEKGEEKRRDCIDIDHIKIADLHSSDLEAFHQSQPHHPKPRIQSCIILPYLKDVVKETRPKIETNVKRNRPELGFILMIVDAIVLRQ
jgi:hypothetical protein